MSIHTSKNISKSVSQVNNLNKQNPNLIPNSNINIFDSIPYASLSNSTSRDNWITQKKRNHSNSLYSNPEPLSSPQEHPRKNKKLFKKSF